MPRTNFNTGSEESYGEGEMQQKTLHSPYPAAKGKRASSSGSVWLMDSSRMATKKPPHSSYFSHLLQQVIVLLPLNVGHLENMQEH